MKLGTISLTEVFRINTKFIELIFKKCMVNRAGNRNLDIVVIFILNSTFFFQVFYLLFWDRLFSWSSRLVPILGQWRILHWSTIFFIHEYRLSDELQEGVPKTSWVEISTVLRGGYRVFWCGQGRGSKLLFGNIGCCCFFFFLHSSLNELRNISE